MKAQFLTALLTMAAPLALADISLGTTTPTFPKATATPAAEEYVQMANEVMAAVKELTTILEGVKDQASADAAAPQVSNMTMRMIELQKKAEAMPRPGIEVENQVRASMNVADVQETVGAFLNAFIRIGMSNGYGSQALLNALGPMMNAMPGSQE